MVTLVPTILYTCHTCYLTRSADGRNVRKQRRTFCYKHILDGLDHALDHRAPALFQHDLDRLLEDALNLVSTLNLPSPSSSSRSSDPTKIGIVFFPESDAELLPGRKAPYPRRVHPTHGQLRALYDISTPNQRVIEATKGTEHAPPSPGCSARPSRTASRTAARSNTPPSAPQTGSSHRP